MRNLSASIHDRLLIHFRPENTVFAAWLAFAMLVGAAAAVIHPILLGAFFVVVVIAPLSIAFPAQISAALLILSFGLVPFLPVDFRVFSELAAYAGLGVVVVRYLMGERDFLAILAPIKWPLFALCAAWLVALFIGYVQKHYAFAGADARRYMGLLAIPLLALVEHRRPGSAHRLAIGMAILAALMLVVQFGSGLRIFAGSKGFMEGGVGKGFEDVARGSAEGGNYLIVYALFYCFLSFALGALRRNRLWVVAGFSLFLVAIIAIFSRGIWAGVVGAALSLIIFSGRYRWSVFVSGIQVVCLLGVVVLATYPVAPRHYDSVYSRVVSIEEEGGRGTSLGSRFDENSQAVEAIARNPVLGLGHGGEYKRFALQVQRGFVNEASFVHNSYLWVALKLGVLGVIGFMGLVFVYLKFALSAFSERSAIEEKVRSLAAIGALVTLLVNGFTSPVWAQFSDLVAFSLLLVMLCGGAFRNNVESRPS